MVVIAASLATSLVVSAGEIHDAVQGRKIARVKQLLAKSPDLVNARAEDGVTPLHLAARLNDIELAKLLLAKGADINAKTKEGRTPLHTAINEKANAVVELLVTKTPIAYTDRFLDARYPEGEKAREAEELKRAYEIFRNLMKKEPGNEKINFVYGLTCLSLKDNPRARLAFERVLQVNPGNDRARVELACTYLASGQPELARQEFEDVLTRNPKESARRTIEGYLQQIKRGMKRWSFSGRVDAGAFDDDNVNVGPDSEIISIAPIIFGATTISTLTVGEPSRPLEAEGIFSSIALSGTYDTGEQGKWVGTADGSYYQNWLDDEHDHESLFCQAAVGMRHTGTRSMLQLPVKVAHITSGHDPLVNMYGVSPSHLYVYGPGGEWYWITTGTAEIRDYDDLNDRDGFYVQAGETMRRYFGRDRHNISMGLLLSHDHTDEAVYEYTGLAWSLGGEMKLPWNSAVYAMVRHTTTDYAEREVLAPEKREDTQQQFVAGIKKTIRRRWGVDINHQQTDNNSTFGLYQYDRSVTTISTSYTF